MIDYIIHQEQFLLGLFVGGIISGALWYLIGHGNGYVKGHAQGRAHQRALDITIAPASTPPSGPSDADLDDIKKRLHEVGLPLRWSDHD